jgi:hypothetical protein
MTPSKPRSNCSAARTRTLLKDATSRFRGGGISVAGGDWAASSRSRTGRARAISVLAATLLAACDGDEADGGEAPPTFTEIHERVLQTSCVFSTCHKSGPSPAGEMTLERDVAHANLVDVPSPVVAGKIRVVAGDPDASYLMEKLTASMPAAGDPMPPDAPLEAERIELVRAWIEAGAADD